MITLETVTAAELAKIRSAIKAAIKAGAGDDWDHPAAAAARDLTEAAGWSWDFTTWADTLEIITALQAAD